MHTSLENIDNNCDDACMDDKYFLHENICEDNSDHFCENIFVEEHEFTPKHVEKIVRTPFGRKPLDLNIFTFYEQLNDKLFDDNVNANECGEII